MGSSLRRVCLDANCTCPGLVCDTRHWRLTIESGCVGVLAVFSIGDMVVYNRRKRAIYFAEEEKAQAKILEAARIAVAEGSASPAQMALVTGIAEEQELMEKKKAERKVPSKLLWWLHGDWKEEKEIEAQRKLAVEDLKRQELEASKSSGVTAAVHEARANTLPTPIAGGPLDQAAEKMVQKTEQTSKGWLGWMMGGSKKE